jgi:spermidine synthase
MSRVPIDISEERGVRSLHFGSHWIQGAMRIARPYALELEYTRDMMLALLLRAGPRWPREALMIGLGTASLVKFLHRHRPHARLRVVEIEPAVIAAARAFFHLPDDPLRLAIEIGDGAEYVARAGRVFDLILVDGFDAAGRAGALDESPFYRAAAARLSGGGLLVTNLLSRRRSVAPSLERIREPFAGRVVALPRSEAGNTIAVAAAGEPIEVPLVQLRTRARALRAATGLNLLPTLARLAAALGGEGTSLRL